MEVGDDTTCETGRTLWTHAHDRGGKDIHAAIDTCNINGCTPLGLAAFKKHSEATKLLLRSGADVDKTIGGAEKYDDKCGIEVREFIATMRDEIEAEAIAQAPEINQMIAYIKICGYCGTEDDGMMKCAGCGTVAYCCRRCQKKAWRGGHREICKRIQRERAEEEEEEKKRRTGEAATTVERGGSNSAASGMTPEDILESEEVL